MKKRISKRMKTGLLCGALAGVMSIGGIMAYFTDGDTATNTMTVGKISIDLLEPNWREVENITPGQDIRKDPQVTNDGINDAYVFLKVDVPYANVTIVNEDGTKNDKSDTELFSYKVNDGWVEVGTGVKDEENQVVTHLYAYGTDESMTPLATEAFTPTLFDYVRFANVIEGEGLEETTQDIVINAYGIQTLNINDAKDEIDGNNADGKVKPADVWEVLNNQTPVTDDKNDNATEDGENDTADNEMENESATNNAADDSSDKNEGAE